MLKAELYLKDINYNSITDIMMPYLAKWLSEKDNTFLDLFKNIISKKGKPSGFSKFLINIIPGKDYLVASIISNNEGVLVEYLNELIQKNGVIAVIREINFDTVEGSKKDMLKIEVTIDAIDYEETIVNLAPMLLQKMTEQEGNTSKLAQLLIKTKDLPCDVLKAAIGAIPKEQRDELLANILTIYKQELSESLNEAITKNNIKAEIKDFNIGTSNHQLKYL